MNNGPEKQIATLDPEIERWVATQWRSFNDKTSDEQKAALQKCFVTLPTAWGASEFVAKTCVARPQMLVELVTSGDLFRGYNTGELTRRAHTVEPESEQELMQWLRRLRTRECVRLTWRDVAGWADLDEVMATMSELADSCVNLALRSLYRSHCQHFGTPLSKTGGDRVSMAVLGLGKLGGCELNFSSDIDLVFAYSEQGETDGPKPISNHEFFLKLARKLIKVLDQPTEDGIVFRVDMRLRPNGESGPLALSFDAIEQYYQTHGRDWERYALIKARHIAGDKQAGAELLAKLHPFVYRRYLDYGAFEAVRAMKEMINRELRRKGVQNNIKLGQGGIREIEFIAQSFQLIRGGRDPQLQCNRLIPVLQHLGRGGIIPEDACAELISSYRFLRKLEHHLQMIRDQQTHRVPEGAMDRKRLLMASGAGHWDELENRITTTCAAVHQHFDQVFVPVHGDERSKPDEIEGLWLGLLDSPIAHRALAGYGYRDTGAVINSLRSLRGSRVYYAHSSDGRERLDRLMPMFIREAGLSPDPDDTLHRLIQFIEGVGRRSVYLVLLIENPLALSQLVKLIGASAWVSSWIRQHPLLLDELLDPITADVATSPQFIVEELDQRLSHIAVDDLEVQMDVLREVRHGQSLRVAAADVSGLIDCVEVGRRLSLVAEITLSRTIELCIDGLGQTVGSPSVKGGTRATLGVVAYGKLGSQELGYNSDLDIVFLHHGAPASGMTEGGSRTIGNEQYYSRLVQRIVHAVTTRTAAGVLYELDMRLRPSGRAGPVITSMDGYRNYQLSHAWTWEHQALVRARMIIGPDSLCSRFEEIRREVLCQPRDPAKLKVDIKEMRAKMLDAHDGSDQHQFDLKHGTGGIVDVEFIVQYFVLGWAHAHPELIAPRNNIKLIDLLQQTGLVTAPEAAALAGAYDCYLTAEHHAKLGERAPRVPATALREDRRRVKMLWQRLFD